jgi:1,2-diacylglycerol 3-alpha-glucosyltransferase
VAKKNLPGLLKAYSAYRNAATDTYWKLVLLGDGPLRNEIMNLRNDFAISHDVLLPGFIQYPELPSYYGLASAFVHASTSEPWGLVVNEAMASGLPVIVSNRCGCAVDLVLENRNGFTFDPAPLDDLMKLMQEISRLSPDRLREMGEASRGIIAGFTPKHFAEGAAEAMDAALRAQKARASRLDLLLLNALIYRWV